MREAARGGAAGATLAMGVLLTGMLLTVLAVGDSAAPAGAAGAATIGRAAPDFRLAGVSGTPFGLERFHGRAVYINVFASWCPPCRGEIPTIVAAYAKYGARVEFLGVDAQEPAAVARRFAAGLHVRYPIGIDRGQMAVTYGAASLPESVFIDKRGVIRAIVHGTVDAATLERNLNRIAER